MTSVEEHLKKIREHLEAINKAIDLGIERWPANIGFNVGACSLQLLELRLHLLNKIPIGKTIKHNWFKRPLPEQKISPLIERKLQIDFPLKTKIYDLIYGIEEQRSNLIYGKSDKEQIRKILETFLKLKALISIELSKEGIKIE